MGDKDYDDFTGDKQWAANYILGPLHDPEPSQVCATRLKPNPPTSAAAGSSRTSFSRQIPRTTTVADPDEDLPLLRRVLSRTGSIKRKPVPPPSRSNYPPLSGLERKRSLHTANPPQTRWNQGTILSRANSVSTPSSSADAMAGLGDQSRPRRRAGSLVERYPGDQSHRPLDMLTQEHRAREGEGSTLPRRSASLRERFPGDMSHRPLAMLTRDHRAADRAPHLRTHRRQQPSDTIDSLDVTGPVPGVTYHHSGPFDATMKERNRNKKYAPVEAVKDTNMEALKATPAEYVQDSLQKHVPLQGTAVVPPGMRDLSGRTMQYEEGADLMREQDAAGGAYKRWDHVRYRDDDFKGKGEPFFSSDQARREQKARDRQHGAPQSSSGTVYYEMQPSSSSSARDDDAGTHKEGVTHVRQRSVSNGAQLVPGGLDGGGEDDYGMGSSGLQRSNTTGKSLAQSLKRRFGSLRRRRVVADEAGY